MVPSKKLSLFLLDHNQNGFCNSNLRLIQDLMRYNNPVSTKFKCVCTDFPNLALLTKSATTGDIQVTFGHASVENNPLREILIAFALTGYH